MYAIHFTASLQASGSHFAKSRKSSIALYSGCQMHCQTYVLPVKYCAMITVGKFRDDFIQNHYLLEASMAAHTYIRFTNLSTVQ